VKSVALLIPEIRLGPKLFKRKSRDSNHAPMGQFIFIVTLCYAIGGVPVLLYKLF